MVENLFSACRHKFATHIFAHYELSMKYTIQYFYKKCNQTHTYIKYQISRYFHWLARAHPRIIYAEIQVSMPMHFFQFVLDWRRASKGKSTSFHSWWFFPSLYFTCIRWFFSVLSLSHVILRFSFFTYQRRTHLLFLIIYFSFFFLQSFFFFFSFEVLLLNFMRESFTRSASVLLKCVWLLWIWGAFR